MVVPTKHTDTCATCATLVFVCHVTYYNTIKIQRAVYKSVKVYFRMKYIFTRHGSHKNIRYKNSISVIFHKRQLHIQTSGSSSGLPFTLSSCSTVLHHIVRCNCGTEKMYNLHRSRACSYRHTPTCTIAHLVNDLKYNLMEHSNEEKKSQLQ